MNLLQFSVSQILKSHFTQPVLNDFWWYITHIYMNSNPYLRHIVMRTR